MARRRGGRAASAGPTRSGSQTAEAPAGKRRGEKKTEEARVGSRQSKRQRGEPPETALGIPDAKRQKLDAIPEEPEVEGEAETERRADARREIQTAVEPKGKGETAREREPEPVVEPEEEEEPEGAKMSELKGHVEERAKERAEERNLGRQGSISPSPDRHGSPLVASHRQSESDGGSDSEGADEPSSSADEPAPVCLHCIETGGRCDFDINEYPRRPCYECLRYGFANTGKPVFCRILCETCVQHATTLATSMTSQKFEAKKVPAQCRTCTKTLVRESKGRGLCRGCFEGLYPCVFNAKDPTQPCKRCLDKAVLGQEVECRKFCRPCMTIVRNVETGMWTIENITNHLDKGRSKKEIAECLDVVLSPTEWLEKNPAPSGTQLRHNLGVEHKFDEQRDATGIWVRVAVLGAGGYGKAILVMKHNARGVTVDRVLTGTRKGNRACQSYCLINGLVDPPELHFNDKTSDWSGEMPRFRRMPLKFKLNGEACVYSSALARLAYQCLQYDPAARPSPSDLKQQIYSARRDNQMLPHKDWPWKELLEDLKKMDDVWALNEKIEELLKLKNK
ncbi:hypothetical protein LTR28_003955 [Elasticomyces elasticus]|nr:hypothetical protein LTR28_003955 [Elasticomyces elasticus]